MTDITRLSVKEASAKLAEGWSYLDVRTVEEFEAGHVPGATNVPLLHAGPGGMAPNPDFLPAMRAAFRADAKLVVGCKSGGRSMRAANELLAAGYTNILELRPGWDGARNPFGQVTEPGWSRTDEPVEQGQPAGRCWDDVRKQKG